MTMTSVGIEELRRAGLFDKDSDYGGMIGDAVKELLILFGQQGHSGMSANITATLFFKLSKGEVLSPLTDDPSEWMEVSDDLFQSNRCHCVFKDKDGVYSIDGKVFSDDGGRSFYTSINSRVYFNLPGYPPKTEKIILAGGPL